MGRDLERTHQADRRRLALAVACRCRLLLPSRILPFVIPVQYVDVRPRLLAELPLLPRPRHVGYRGLHLSNSAADGAAVRLCPARIPGPAPCGRRAERRSPRVPRPPVSLGERTPEWRRGDSAVGAASGLGTEREPGLRECVRPVPPRDRLQR